MTGLTVYLNHIFSRGNFPDSVCIEGAEIETESDSKKLIEDPEIWNAKILPAQVAISPTIFYYDNSKKLVHFQKQIPTKSSSFFGGSVVIELCN